MSNFEYLGNNQYIVKNQNGFKNAVTHAMEGYPIEQCGRASSYPKRYPAALVITVGYSGYDYPEVTVLDAMLITDKLVEYCRHTPSS